MAHPISPIQYRAGKTFAWRTNIILSSPNSSALIGPGDLNLSTGIEFVTRHLLKNYRIFSVRSTLGFSEKTNTINIKLLYVPRIKIADRSLNDIDDRTSLMDRTLLRHNETVPEDILLSYFMHLQKVIDEEHVLEIETETPWSFFQT
jgi:hypothetical protein